MFPFFSLMIQSNFVFFDLVLKLKSGLEAVHADTAGGTDDVIDIDLEDPDVEKAALTIQASFRKHLSHQELVKKQSQSTDVETPGPSNVDTNGTKNNDEEVIDIDLDDPEVAAAAEKIQKGFKKHMFKKNK